MLTNELVVNNEDDIKTASETSKKLAAVLNELHGDNLLLALQSALILADTLKGIAEDMLKKQVTADLIKVTADLINKSLKKDDN